jgi:hypothetical protein
MTSITPTSIRRTELRQIQNALLVMARKTLPSLSSELKVTKLLRAVRPAVEDLEAAINKFTEARSRDDGEGRRVPINPFTFNKELEAEMALSEVVNLPDIRLSVDDLPAALKGDKGEANRESNAAIMVDLAFLFDLPAD